MTKTALQRALYRRYAANVNRPDRSGRTVRSAIGVWLAAGLLAVGTGCASTQPARTDAATSYLTAVRYDVEPAFAREGRQEALATIRRDFQKIAEIGFDGVVLRHVDDRDGRTLLNIAGASGLQAALPRRNFVHFVATGTLPKGIGDPARLRFWRPLILPRAGALCRAAPAGRP